MKQTVVVIGDLHVNAGGGVAVVRAKDAEEAASLAQAHPGALVIGDPASAAKLEGIPFVAVDAPRAAQEKLRVAEKVVDVLVHDLRTPLSAVRLGGEVVNASAPSPSVKRTAERVLRSADRMSRLLQQLLDFTRAWLGEALAIRASEARLGDVVRSAVATLPAEHQQKVDVEVLEDGTGTWDAERLCQAIGNLLVNAVTHGVEGGRARVRASIADHRAIVEVHNAGGIADEVRPRLFQPIGPGARPQSGVGLGLYLAERVASAHKGRVELSSSAEEGTTVRLIVPSQSPTRR